MKQMTSKQPIDFVIAWVDGDDVTWQAEKNKYAKEYNSVENIPARYRDWGFLPYWFRAVEKYAPWVNKIYFVTCGHIPNWLNTANEKLVIVRHEEFIPSEYLPTFNSHTIELNLHRIKGLSEQFVYFNDDMFLVKPVSPNDFFVDGKPCDIFGLDSIAFGSNTAGMYNANDIGLINDHFPFHKAFVVNKGKWLHASYGLKLNLRTVFLLHKKYFPGFYYQHTVSVFLKSTFIAVWEKESKVLDETCKCRFRMPTNVNQWLIKYWQLAEGNFYPGKKNFGMCAHLQDRAEAVVNELAHPKHLILCINDTGKTVNYDELRDQIGRAFRDKLPEISTFEKS